MIDVHILKTNRGFFEECIQSVKSDHITLHILDRENENHGKARMEGYSQGVNPYVAAVDDDDILVPEVFDRAIAALRDSRCSAYYSNHHVMDVNKKVYGQWFYKPAPSIGFSQALQMHHVVVYRRRIIEPVLEHLDGVHTQDKRLLNLASIDCGGVVGDSFKGLYWRVHDGGAHKKASVRDNPESWKNQIEYYQKKILGKMDA